jgi:hypothetical protein
MKDRDFVWSVLWSLAPVVCVFRFLGHGLLWLVLSGIRKVFQLKYKTGFAALVLLERSHLQSSLMSASFVVFRIKTGLRAVASGRGTTQKAQTPAQAHTRAN